jgi:predicted TIM-barrel fold metal-dependent hydrolase
VFKRNVKVHLFMDTDPVGLVRQLGADVCVFGSDFAHPEGQANPLDFADRLEGLTVDEKAKIMGGNLDAILGTAQPAGVA